MKFRLIACLLFLSFIIGALGGYLITKSIFQGRQIYSIGIYSGSDNLNLHPHPLAVNPVINYNDITDASTIAVADPFMVKNGSAWYMFFEVINEDSGRGEIGLAISEDAIKWQYEKIILKEPFHLSYPYVFESNGTYYMIPESEEAGAIRLYKCKKFPFAWSFDSVLVKGRYCDPSIFNYNNMWYMFASEGTETLRLFYSKNITGPWTEHPNSPIIKENPNTARPGGRVLVIDKKIYRYAQDDYPNYASGVRAFEIYALSETDYSEREVEKSPILSPSGTGWNASGMHHIDAHLLGEGGWIACVDGWKIQRFRERIKSVFTD